MQIKYVFSQDTLIFHSGQKKVVEVLEINPTDVKYYRYKTKTPLYIQNVYEVFCIKYPNGIIDTVTKTSLKYVNVENQQLRIVDSRIFNNKGPLREARLKKLIYDYPKPIVRDQLVVKYKYLGRQDKVQLLSLLTGLGTGYVSINVLARLNKNDNAIPVAIVSTAIIGTSIYFFVKAKQNIKRGKRELVKLYNDNL